jgi:hypothetical protein
MALIVGAKTFYRLFTGIRFDELTGPLLYVYARDEEVAAEIEDFISRSWLRRLSAKGSKSYVVMPKVLQ